MRCRLCGYTLSNPDAIWCMTCDDLVMRWDICAKKQHKSTGRWPKISVEFGPGNPTIKVDSSGGLPDPNKYFTSHWEWKE